MISYFSIGVADLHWWMLERWRFFLWSVIILRQHYPNKFLNYTRLSLGVYFRARVVALYQWCLIMHDDRALVDLSARVILHT